MDTPEETAEERNILRQQGALVLIQEELRRDLESATNNLEMLKERVEMAEADIQSLRTRMKALDRMIAEVRS